MKSESTASYEALIQFLYQAPIGLMQTTPDGEITMINPKSAQLLMPLAPDGNLRNLFDVLYSAAPQLRALVASFSPSSGVICESLRVPLPAGPARGALAQTLQLSLLKLDSGTLMVSLGDATLVVHQEQQRMALQLHDATRTDNLTGLPNRAVVLERIERALVAARRAPESGFAVMFINCDRFNRVNVTLGQDAGDELLRLLAGRLDGTVRAGDAVGRPVEPQRTAACLGGDEFAVVLEGLRHADDAQHIAQRLLDALCKPYSIAGQLVHASVSMGVVLRAQASANADSLLQEASIAMREAKREGGARYSVFEPSMGERAARRGIVESGLRRALLEDELFVVYQPIVGLASGVCVGAEALVRWRHPSQGIVPPAEFIEVAEETGLIGAIGEFVLNEACREFVRWLRALGDRAPRTMSVNLSRAQLSEPALVNQVAQALRSSGMPAANLQLEVTETLAAQDADVQARLHELKSLGLTLALDDFGTGYSSLASLHLFPVDVVKIDRSFVSQAETSLHHRALIAAMVRVAHSLGMGTVAEGIETTGQAAVLARLQCDKGQGYLFAKPLVADEALRWMAARPHAGVDTTSAVQPANDVTVEQLIKGLRRSNVAIALFDPQERLVFANRSFVDVHCGGAADAQTWEDIMRGAHKYRRGLLIDTDDIEGWLTEARRQHRTGPRRVSNSDFCGGRSMRVTEETQPDGWQLVVSTDVTSLKSCAGDLRRAGTEVMLGASGDPKASLRAVDSGANRHVDQQ